MPSRRLPRHPLSQNLAELKRRTWRGGLDGTSMVPRPVTPDHAVFVLQEPSVLVSEPEPEPPSNYPILFKFDEVSGTQAEDFYHPGSYMNFTAEPTWGQTPLAPGSTSAMFNNSGYGSFSAPAVEELQEYVFDVWLQKTNNGCDTDNLLLTVGVVNVLTNCGQVYAGINGEAWTIPVAVGFPGPAVRVQGSYSVLTGYWTFQVGENFQDGFVSATGAVDSLLVEVWSADNGTAFDELYVNVNTPT